MRKMEDDCVECGLPCIGRGCPYHGKHLHIYCDKCGEEGEKMYSVDGEDYCEGCLIADHEAEIRENMWNDHPELKYAETEEVNEFFFDEYAPEWCATNCERVW